jgi:ligand-binding SRPBCC domain-containing protein
MMRTLVQEQFLPISLDEAWDFFSSPHNLNLITPDDMTFKITSHIPEKMYPGMMITYKVSPVPGVAMNWATEITHVHDRAFFVDEQRMGPYRIWHHEHHFEAVPGGVKMVDKLYYDIGKSVFGWIAGAVFVHAKVRQIFEFRHKKLVELFGEMPR